MLGPDSDSRMTGYWSESKLYEGTSCSGQLKSSLSLLWEVRYLGSSFTSSQKSSSFTRAQNMQHYLQPSRASLKAKKLAGLAETWARVVLGIGLIYCELFLRPVPALIGYQALSDLFETQARALSGLGIVFCGHSIEPGSKALALARFSSS